MGKKSLSDSQLQTGQSKFPTLLLTIHSFSQLMWTEGLVWARLLLGTGDAAEMKRNKLLDLREFIF